MADITSNTWSEADSDNTQPSPLGLPPGILPSELGGAVRAVMGAVKRSHSRSNAMVTSTGSSNAYALAYSVGPTAYVKGEVFRFFANHTNTGAATLNINGLGTRSLLRADGSAVAPGEIVASQVVSVICDGVNFLAQSITTKEFKSNVVISVNGEAAVSVEDTGAPATSFRQKKIVSTRTANGGNDLVLRQTRPSDGAVEDFTLKSGTAGTIFTTGNFNPALKADLAGATFTGTVSVKSAPGIGASSLVGGSADRTGYVEFRDKDGARHGYIGWSNGTNLELTAEKGVFAFNSRPIFAGATPWDTGNFNPGSKANLTGAAFTGAVSGTSATFSGAGSFGSINVGARPSWAGLTPWDNGNFDPSSKATLNAYGIFTGLGFTGGETYLYKDSGLNNLVVRTGPSNAYRYSTFAQDGLFTSSGSIRANGDLIATSRVVVGEGQNNSFIEMRDTDEGTRYIHNNGGTIGFLGNDGGWKLRMYDDGRLWTAQLGDLNTRIEDRAYAHAVGQANSARNDANANANNRVAKSGDTMSGDLTISKTYPCTTYLWGGVVRMQWMVDNDGSMMLRNGDNGSVYMRMGTNGRLASSAGWTLETDGNLYMPWAGAYLSTMLDRRVAKTGDTMTGDLEIQKGDAQITLHWPGQRIWQMRTGTERLFFHTHTGGNRVSFGSDGSISTAQFGDLNTRIENRINNKSSRFAYAGDLNANNPNFYNAYWEPYGGAAATGFGSQQYGLFFFNQVRFRYLQMSNSNGDWYTCGYV